ncbi:MAG: hypothetical protein HC851_16845 [Acaryochloris sp. RU_4_1]|nr:hypothetical protein [Acaryochloris sp. RU_4_1]NJR55951.1 hypothetical protein [Acaryochloris sp. CRU_2_0]
MTRSKLSDSDKQQITQLFQASEQTIGQLADRFEVSSSTIRRLLKSQLSDQDYETLLTTKQEKRGSQSSRTIESNPPLATEPIAGKNDAKPSKVLQTPPRSAPIKKRTHSEENVVNDQISAPPQPALSQPHQAEDLAKIIAEIEYDLQDEDLDSGDEDEDLDDFVSADSDLDDFELDEVDDSDIGQTIGMALESSESIQVLPVSEAQFPKTCYLVVDRSSELITCPLQEFGELGLIPEDEVDAKTLPIFDNHRIARRFSHRSQRIVKVPNGNVLKKTCTQLLAKGITRLLINGNVYSLLDIS